MSVSPANHSPEILISTMCSAPCCKNVRVIARAPLREGGSLPAIVEAYDLGLYVVTFRGAGQGPLSLVCKAPQPEIQQLFQQLVET
jgi:hypothetical protein